MLDAIDDIAEDVAMFKKVMESYREAYKKHLFYRRCMKVSGCGGP